MSAKPYNPSMAVAAFALREAGFPVSAVARALRVQAKTAEILCEYRHREDGEDAQEYIARVREQEALTEPREILPDAPPPKDTRTDAEIVRDRMLASLKRAVEIVESGLNEAPSIGEGLRVAKEYVQLLPKVQAAIAGAQGEEEEPEDLAELVEYLRKQRRQIDERLSALGRVKDNIP